MKKRRLKQTVAMTAICLFAGGVLPLSVQAAPENGWEKIGDDWYWYENGVKQGLEGRGKEIHDPDSDAWYWLDSDANGKRAVSKDLYQESAAGQWAENEDGTGKWVRYDENGHMIKGWNTNENGTYYFDLIYGTMAKGEVEINGLTYYFNAGTGVLESSEGGLGTDTNGWQMIDGVEYWYENGVRQGLEGRGKEIYDPGSDAWYWLDSDAMGKKAVSKDVYQESKADDAGNIGKWVRYDENGHMIKGWNDKDGNRYYFDLTYGTMAKGEKEIDGVIYIFNQNTGILEGEKQPNSSDDETTQTYEFQYEFHEENMTATLTGVENGVEEAIIPAEVTKDGKTYTVTTIGSAAFASSYSLKKVEIPDTVTVIEDNVFAWCYKLESINLPKNLTSLEDWAFLGCSALTEIVLPDSLTTIEYSVFNGCSGLTKVNIPSAVTFIADNAFDGCVSLSNLVIPKTVIDFADDAFFGVANVHFENPEAYENAGSARAVDGYIENDVVYKDSSKKELLAVLGYVSGEFSVPDSVTVIGDYAFLDCENLTKISIPNTVTSIGEGAFSTCLSLTEVNIPDGITTIGNETFYRCTDLTELTIPSSVTSIGEEAFGLCRSLTTINIPDGITAIEDETFAQCEALTEIIIPDSVTSIGEEAFAECETLPEVNIPDSVTEIGTDAFKGIAHITYNGTATGSPWGATAIN